jgi:hypothetical protein
MSQFIDRINYIRNQNRRMANDIPLWVEEILDTAHGGLVSLWTGAWRGALLFGIIWLLSAVDALLNARPWSPSVSNLVDTVELGASIGIGLSMISVGCGVSLGAFFPKRRRPAR